MRATAGQFTLRHGNRTQVYGNYILGDGAAASAGLRVYGGDHKIFNNYIDGVSGAGILIDSGNSNDTSGALTDHKLTYDIEVVFNTIVSGTRHQRSAAASPCPRATSPSAYNLVQGDVITPSAAPACESMGNIVNGSAAGSAAA